VPLSGKTDMPTLETARRNLLEELFAAFNRHDGSAVMACMTEDIIFDAATGPDISGRRLTGASEVRTAFESTWTGMPDVSWQCTRHEVFGDRGISEWIFRATTKEGQRIEAEGCDLFSFRGDRICIKSAFRKDRPLLAALRTGETARQ
jgi:ketosteroid isomerase-like protein